MRAGALTVYLVEDDASVRDSLALMLGLAGYATAAYADAESFLAAWRADWAGCVVTDLRLPGMNGIDATRRIHAEHPGTRVIGLSMSEEAEKGAAMKGAGAVRYLSKSASLDALLAAIRESPGTAPGRE